MNANWSINSDCFFLTTPLLITINSPVSFITRSGVCGVTTAYTSAVWHTVVFVWEERAPAINPSIKNLQGRKPYIKLCRCPKIKAAKGWQNKSRFYFISSIQEVTCWLVYVGIEQKIIYFNASIYFNINWYYNSITIYTFKVHFIKVLKIHRI